jgi:hypothetical protein
MDERRKSERYPCVIDVTITCDSGSYRAEVFDVNSTGMGISWIHGNQSIPNDTPAQIKCDHPPFDQQPLSGLIKGCPSQLTYRPNVRSVGLEIDQECKDLIERVVQSCVNEVEAPQNKSPGLRRAWNVLRHQERIYMREYFEELNASKDKDERQVANNLMNDSNSPGHRWRNFMKVLLEQVVKDKGKGVAPFDTLKKAFVTYKKQYSLHDAERDKPIHVDLTGSVAFGGK